MRTAQRRCLALVAASLLLLSAVNARNFDIADPRNGIDHAPLKVDKISLDTPRDGRRVLAEGQPQAAPEQEPAAAAQQAAASSSAPSATAQPASVATAAISKPAAAVPVATAAVSQPAAATTAPAAAATASKPAAAASAGPTASVPTQPHASKAGRKSRAAVAAAGVQELSAPPRKGGDSLQLLDDKVEQMTLEQLLAEDAPPTACRWEPKTAGIKWNVGCANKALGASCDGMVLAQPPFCDGKGGSIATTRCLPDGEWGQVEVLC